MQLQKLPLHLVLGGVVSGQRHVCRDEGKVDRACLQPVGAAQHGGLAWPRPLTSRAKAGSIHLLLGRLLLLLDVLVDVDVLHDCTDALSDRLVVQVAVGEPDCTRLGRKEGCRTGG